MSKRAIVVLAAVAAALFAYIAVFERQSLTSKELAERKARVLTTFVRSKVDQLEIERKGKRVVLERKPNEEGDFGAWRMVKPEPDEADESTVDQVLGELEWLSARRTLEGLKPEDEKSFGLAAPRYRVWYRAGGERHRVTIGNPDVHGESVYLRIDDEPRAYVVPKTLSEALDHEASDYRTKELIHDLTFAWVKQLVIESEQGKHELAKEGDRWWYLGEPKSFADAKRVDELLRALDELKAARYLEGDAQKQALAMLQKPERIVRVRVVPDVHREDKAARTIELRLGGPCPGHDDERVAQIGAQGAPVCVAKSELSPFEVGPTTLRQAALLSVDPSEVESFELSAGANKLSLSRKGESWVPQGSLTVDREAVESWLARLSEERARSFEPLAKLDERYKLTLKTASGKAHQIVFAEGGPNKTLLARRDDEPVLITLPMQVVDLLDPSPKRFSSLEPWASHQPSEIARVEAREGKLSRKLTLENGEWRAEPQAALDQRRVREQLRDLIKLRVRGFVGDKPRAEHGLETPSARLVLGLSGGGQLTLDVGAATERGAYARIDGGAVYELGRETLDTLHELAGGAPVAQPPLPQPDPHADDENDEAHDHEGDHAHE